MVTTGLVRTIFVLALHVFVSQLSAAQAVVGPEANPRKRLDCAAPGQVRDDRGVCTDVRTWGAITGRRYWVDARYSGASAGTEQQPFKSHVELHASVRLAPGDAVITRQGTYRESIEPEASGVKYICYPGEQCVISGADPIDDGWTLHKGNIYKRSITDKPYLQYDCPWKDCSAHWWQRELLVVDDTLLTLVPDLESVDGPGKYYVNTGRDAAGSTAPPTHIYAWFPGGDAPSNHEIEYGTRSPLFLPKGSNDDCEGSTVNDLHVIGYEFRYDVSNRQGKAVCPGASGALFEENVAALNGWGGFKCAATGHTFRGNTARDNGQFGIGGGCDDSVVEYNRVVRNGFRLRWGAPSSYNFGGGKYAKAERDTLRRNLYLDNEGPGIWLDNGNQDNVLLGNVVARNLKAGIMLEQIGTEGNLVANNVIYGTRWDGVFGSGVLNVESKRNYIVHNTIYGNDGTGVWVRNDSRNSSDPTIPGEVHIYNNLILDNNRRGGKGHEIFLANTTNRADGNVYSNHADMEGTTFFYGPDGTSTNDISVWHRKTGNDASSALHTPGSDLIASLSEDTGWRLLSNSLARGKAVALPPELQMVLTDIQGDPRPKTGGDVGADQFVGTSTARIQKIPLHKGWNVVSSWVRPVDTSLEAVFSGIVQDVKLVKDRAGNTYSPQFGINSIGKWEPREAYMVFASNATTLTIDGSAVDAGVVDLPLVSGWNLIPFLHDAPLPVEVALAPLLPNLVLAKDEDGKAYVPGEDINTIGEMEPGEGYWIYTKKETIYSGSAWPQTAAR